MSDLNIVMYHYVRPILGSKNPNIKGLELDGFRRQLDFLTAQFNVINAEQLLAAIREGESLPPNACWLTFDDGYRDHYQFVLPELIKRKLQGTFFPPQAAVEQRQLLDANAIHYLLDKSTKTDHLSAAIDEGLLLSGATDAEISQYKTRYRRANRFDDAETIYVKRMLQHVLPREMRQILLENLVIKLLNKTSCDLADELYMTSEELQEMISAGMFVGSHGAGHDWLNELDVKAQEFDIQTSLDFLKRLGAESESWIMCYPFGAYSEDTLSIISRLGACAGVTTRTAKADLAKDNPLLLPRYDTNDFPQ